MKLEIQEYGEINTLLNKQWVKKEIKRKIRKYNETNKNKNRSYQTYEMWQKQYGGVSS